MKKKNWRKTAGLVIVSLFLAGASLPAAAAEEALDLKDGAYSVRVELQGGSGKSTITSPTVLTVKDGVGTARIEWSSPHYDYMKVEDETYQPVHTEGNSVFEIPVTVFDEPIPVIADTTAMSTPHEVEYTLLFDGGSLKAEKTLVLQQRIAFFVLVAASGATVFWINQKKRKKVS